jgi:hypothetical protein
VEDRNIKIGDLTIKDMGKVKVTYHAGFVEETKARYIDPSHFEMSNTKGEFDALGSHVWANADYEIFCETYGIKLEAIKKEE